MAKTTIDEWTAGFFERSGIFDSLRLVSLPFSEQGEWPTLLQLSAEFKKRNIQSRNNMQIQPVAQAGAPEAFSDHYESRIYLKGELQTRLENWHDFFNAMCWLQFPKTKTTLNALHFENSKIRQAGTNRSPLENAITLFDECGAVIVADDEAILDLIRAHEWKELFCDNEFWNDGNSLDKHVQCYVFGHAMHEKALTPYIGMTAHTLMLKQDREFFQQDYLLQLDAIDQIISSAWFNESPCDKPPGNGIEAPKDLQAFPLLGVPGWWNKKQDEAFYANAEYFRGKSRRK